MEEYIRACIERTATEYGVKVHQILGPSNIPQIVKARRAAAAAAYLGNADCTRQDIADAMGMCYTWVSRFTRNLRQPLRMPRQSSYESPKHMIDEILAHQGAKFETVFARKNRERKLNRIRRHVVRAVKREFPELPYVELARIVGMHHTSVLYHCGRGVHARQYKIHPVSG